MRKWWGAAMVALAVSGCGGGDGDAGTGTGGISAATAEGFWQGTSTSGFAVSLAILENGETWGVYSSGSVVVGALQGQTQSSGGSTLSGSGSDFHIPSRTVTTGTFTGTFSPKNTISVATSTGINFTGAYQSAYDQPASLSVLAGTFSGSGVTGGTTAQVVVSVSSTGAVTMPANQGCSASGTATPRASGKNIFNVSVTFSGSTCVLGNGATVTGVAYHEVATGRLVVLALNAARTDGFIYLAQKTG